MTEWRAVVGWNGLYEVSDEGVVRSPARVLARDTKHGVQHVHRRERILKAHLKNGYPSVCLKGDGRSENAYVHRLVCELWHGPKPSPKHEVAHENGDRTDPRPLNLRWATRLENIRDKARHGTQPMGERIWLSKLTDESAAEILSSSISLQKAAEKFGVNAATVWAVRTGKTWKHLQREAA